jgi:anti-sigma regulatory factor (Ser/Thr protein kinase)
MGDPNNRANDTARYQQMRMTGTEAVARMAHQLRSPLGVATEYLSLVREGYAGDLSVEQDGYLDTAARNLEYLQNVIDDMLDCARMESSETTRIDFQGARWPDVAGPILEMVGPRCEAAGVTLAADFEADLCELLVEPRRVQQALMNFLCNAITFTPRGGTIALMTHHDPGADYVKISVFDTGVGISEDKQSEVFGAHPASDLANANGLGLTIAREIVERHGGEVGLESRSGLGSRFWFTLPTLTASNIENIVILPTLATMPKRGGSLAVVTVQRNQNVNGGKGQAWAEWIKGSLRGADRVCPLDDDLVAIVAPTCMRASRAIVRRVEESLVAHGMDPSSFWTETVTFPSPGVSRDQFVDRTRRLLRRGGSASELVSAASATATGSTSPR